MLTTVAAAVFADYQRAIAALNRLVTVADAEHLSLVMADREAERHFSAAARTKIGVPLPLDEAAQPVVQGLRPLAALGTRGTGLVASGPMVSILVGAGVGAGLGLRRGLSGLGVEPERVEQVFAKVRNGALILAVQGVDDETLARAERVLAEGSAVQLKLTVEHEGTAKPTLQAPAPSVGDDGRPSVDDLDLDEDEVRVRRAS
jgi:hypothetical protein